MELKCKVQPNWLGDITQLGKPKQVGFGNLSLSRLLKNKRDCSLIRSVATPIAPSKGSNSLSEIFLEHCLIDNLVWKKEGKENTGKFGKYGGKFVPETLITPLALLEKEFNSAIKDPEFQGELALTLKDYVGRETPLYLAQGLTNWYKKSNGEGPVIYLKREDFSHGGASINNAVAQAMLAKRMGRRSVVTASANGQHGIATAAACARLSLDCTIYMAARDKEKQSSNVLLMKLLGAQVKFVDGSFKDATSEATRDWIGNLEECFFLSGTMVGPHPLPLMVREFQSVIGKEVRRQAMERWGKKPDVLIACVGSGSNAMGLFHEFIEDDDVRLIGVEAAGLGLESGKHSATLGRGDVGVYHGSMSYLLQDEEGQIIQPHSIATGLEYPGVGPELSFLKDTGRAEFYSATDEEAADAYKRLCLLEGIVPALEASHALAYLEKLCPTLPNGTKVVVNCIGCGHKDVETFFNFRHENCCTQMYGSKLEDHEIKTHVSHVSLDKDLSRVI